MKNKITYDSEKYNKNFNLIAIIITILLIMSTIIDIKSKKENINNHISTLEQSVINEYKERLKESIFHTISFIDTTYEFYLRKQELNNNKSSNLTKENYKLFENDIRKYLYNNIFDKVRYTWINKIVNYSGGDDYAIRLIHPNLKKSEGKLLSTNSKDIEDNRPYKTELEGMKNTEGLFYTYFFKQFESDEIIEKISYAKLYKKLDWIIATGIPLASLKQKVHEDKKELLESYHKNLFLTITIKLLIFLILLIAVYFFRKINTNYLLSNLRNANKILNDSNEKLLIATQAANIGIWKWDIVNNCFDWDMQMFSIYEIKPNNSSIEFKRWENAIFEDDRKKTLKQLSYSIENKTKFVSIFRINTLSGIKYIKAYGKTTYDDKNKAIYITGVNLDITEVKNQELIIKKQALSLSEYVIYSRTNKDGIITDVSKAFCKISGYSKEELIGKSHNLIRDIDTPDILYTELWGNLKNLKSWKGDIKNRRKDGLTYWVYSDISPEFDSYGNLIGYISIRSDISMKKDFEKQQIQMFEQSKMASLGEMLGNIAHQWRQPLSVISTAATGIKLQKEIGTLDDKLLFNELDLINNNAQYLSETINTFRDFIKEDKKLQVVILQENLNATLEILKATLENNYIKLINNLDDFEDIKIKIVPGELSQVIMNVINNAKDALVENKIEEPLIIIDIKKYDNKIILTIEDNAGGIPENILPHIFEPYFTTKHKSQGTGLGLFMSHKIITSSLNGKIYAVNKKFGAKIYIEIPILA